MLWCPSHREMHPFYLCLPTAVPLPQPCLGQRYPIHVPGVLGCCGAQGLAGLCLLLAKYLLGSEQPPALRACGAGGKEGPVVLRRRYCCKGYTSRSLRLCVCQTNSGSVKPLECQRRGVCMCIVLASGDNTASVIQDSFPTIFGQWLVLCNSVV